MKKNVVNLLVISSLSLFVGCSDKNPQPKKTASAKDGVSVYNIMGIEGAPENYEKEYYYETLTPTYARQQVSMPIISDDIEVIAYGAYPSNVNFPDIQQVKENIEWNAKSFLGTRYVWGATGPDTFDCSGFTQWVYRDVGINIPRVSRDQARVGQYVAYHQLRKGDMVFFDTKKRRNGIVSHVGIYLGHGNFIHASSNAKKVVIYNFDQEPFYKERFMWGRRVIPETTRLAYN